MNYYKIVKDKVVAGVGTSLDMRRWVAKHHVLVATTENDAELIQGLFDDFYHDTWMKPYSGLESVQEAAVIPVDESTYNELYELISGGQEAVEPDDEGGGGEEEPTPGEKEDEEELPMSISEMRAKIAEQEAQISMLTDCLLEMSEIVYEG